MASHDREDEYAEAFRRGYERARRSAEPTVPLDRRRTVPSEPYEHDYPVDDGVDDVAGGSVDPPDQDSGEHSGADERWEDREFWGLDLFRHRDDEERDDGRHDDRRHHDGSATLTPRPPSDSSTSTNLPRAKPRTRPAARRRTGRVLTHRRPSTRPGTPTGPRTDDERRRTALAVVVLALVALALVGAAFGLGRIFADSAGSASDSTTEAAEEAQSGADSGAGGKARAARYDGPVDAVAVAGSSATCKSGSSVDSAGNTVTYDPAKAHDADLSTAWRCPGTGQGQRFRVSLGKDTVVAEVGLVPGYAKTDPVSGADRYAENNRLTKVRWVFDDGTSYVQKMNDDPTDRSMRTMRIPETTTGNVVIELLGVSPGPRNTVAISEIRLASPSS